MTDYNWGFDYPMSACGDMTGNQYRFMTTTGAGGDNMFYLATGASSPGPIGVLQNKPESGNVGAVRILGVTKVMGDATSAILPGDYVTTNASGTAVLTSTGSYVAGVALEGLASGCAYIKVLLLPYADGNKQDQTP